MILQALKEYYDRKAGDPEAGLAPQGFEWKEITYIIALKPDGTPVTLESTIEGEGRSKRAKSFLVPQAVKRSSGIRANLLWDNTEYALGLTARGDTSHSEEKHRAFVQEIEKFSHVDDVGLSSLRSFLSILDKEAVLSGFALTDEMRDSGRNVSFSLSGEPGLILDRPVIREAIGGRPKGKTSDQPRTCLISGETAIIERLHAPIKGVRGAQSTGANIVSFNLDAFESYGKKQGTNAPIGQNSTFAYTTALNHLLRRDSSQKMQVGDATTVFWAERQSDLETQIVDIFGMPLKDDPDRGVNAVRSLYASVQNGAYVSDTSDNRFYVLGLSPNASRIAVRFWIVDTVADMADKIIRHFEDLKITRPDWEREFIPLPLLLASTAPQGKLDNIPPNLAGETMRAILNGAPYPHTLLQAVITRIRAEQSARDMRGKPLPNVSYTRAALIKAWINRKMRFEQYHTEEELTMALDLENKNIGYRLGRLFATLEKIQAESHPGINATIRDRFYSAASGTPVAVFSNLMRLKNHHLAKLESQGRKIVFEKLIAEIMSSINDFPAHLNLADQGRFAVGYYHQTQQFYTKKESNNDTKHESTEGGISHE